MHLPVLQKEVLQYLNPKPGENFIDCTIGEGGHAFAILERIFPNGKLLGIDHTPELIQKVKEKSETLKTKNVILVCDSFVNLKKIVEKHKFRPVHGILFDLGMSSWHLEESGRGFSFLKDEPLIMRYNWNRDAESKKLKDGHLLAAGDIVNSWPERELERILIEYGEERFAKRIAAEIAKARKGKPITRTFQLVDIIIRATPPWYRRKKIHPATRTFQALRIAANDELANLESALPQAREVLEPKGRMVVISFHSLEDRIVKHFLRKEEKEGTLRVMTKKPVTPSAREIRQNPRSRSAKLRAAIKLT
jgi:16S rRNA (cytosine1402-N4)-methyltransferase